MILALDIGATKTNSALFSARSGERFHMIPGHTPKHFLNDRCSGPEEIIASCLKAAKKPVEMVVFAVAGHVTPGMAQLTNIPWAIRTSSLQRQFHIPRAAILNDLEAIAYGIPFLKSGDIQVIHKRRPATKAARAVIAPGTGLGESLVTWSDGRYTVHATEGGHCDFAPTDTMQIELLQFLRKQYDHVSYEHVCSGPGLHNIYLFLRDVKKLKEPIWLSRLLAKEQYPAKSIVSGALAKDRSSEICRQAVQLFISILGAEAGNLALKILPKGGLYIGGGIVPRIYKFLQNGQLLTAFKNKGRMSHVVNTFPVNIIMNPYTALFGAAYFGFNKLDFKTF
jgi:glucokinase